MALFPVIWQTRDIFLYISDTIFKKQSANYAILIEIFK